MIRPNAKMKDQVFIAEIKTQSPFGFKSPYCFSELKDMAVQHGHWISVHTNALWGGDFDSLAFVRRCTGKPILAKGIHATDDDIQRALDHGANYVLVVDRIPKDKYLPHCLLEMNGKGWLPPECKFVCNARNLCTGELNTRYDIELSRFITAGHWVCQASGITHPNSVDPAVDAFIVGENLPYFIKAAFL